METFCQDLKDLTFINGTIKGYLDGKNELNKFVKSLNLSGYQYSCRSSRKKVDSQSSLDHNYATLKKVPVKFTKECGSAMMLVKTEVKNCFHGGKYKPNKNPPIELQVQDHPSVKKKRQRLQPSRKIGCPSVMKVKEVKILSNVKAPAGRADKAREKIIQEARVLFQTGRGISRFYVEIFIEHSHAILPIHLNIDKALVNRIGEKDLPEHVLNRPVLNFEISDTNVEASWQAETNEAKSQELELSQEDRRRRRLIEIGKEILDQTYLCDKKEITENIIKKSEAFLESLRSITQRSSENSIPLLPSSSIPNKKIKLLSALPVRKKKRKASKE